MNRPEEEKREFSSRLNRLMDREGLAQRGRPKWLREQWKIAYNEELSEKAFYKWIAGLTMPETKRINMLANLFGEKSSALLSEMEPDKESELKVIARLNAKATSTLDRENVELLFECVYSAIKFVGEIEKEYTKDEAAFEIAKLAAYNYNTATNRGDKPLGLLVDKSLLDQF